MRVKTLELLQDFRAFRSCKLLSCIFPPSLMKKDNTGIYLINNPLINFGPDFESIYLVYYYLVFP